MKDGIITFENISKSYKDGKKSRLILDSVSGFIDKGSVNVIFGESGCGKTTFLSILSGIERPDKGRVIYKDKDFYSLKPELQSQIRGLFFGIVFQDFNLIDELNAKDNILLPLKINKISLDEEYYKELVTRMGLSKVENSYPTELSGGEKQRTAIARAMITRPDIIFADEPTGNLDERNSKQIAEIFSDMNERFGTTIVVVTHDQELFREPDAVFYIRNGKCVNI